MTTTTTAAAMLPASAALAAAAAHPAADLSAAGLANRAKGRRHELDCLHYLHAHGYPNAERQRYEHRNDIVGTGDLAVECKYTDWKWTATALDQAFRDAQARGLDRGIILKKRRGLADVCKGFWIGQIDRELAAARELEELRKVADAEQWAAYEELRSRHPGEFEDICRGGK